MNNHSVIIRTLGFQDYQTSWQAMQEFTQQRTGDTLDEIWLLEHHPIFTQGQNGKSEHLLSTGNIPVIKTDRGGQVTYHGPGQLVAYMLIDMKRKKFHVRELVTLLEKSVIGMLADYHIQAQAKCEAPGVYCEQNKICSIGLRIRRGCSYHGLALNVALDLEPFERINPCGFHQLKMTSLSEQGGPSDISSVSLKLTNHLIKNLGYTDPLIQ